MRKTVSATIIAAAFGCGVIAAPVLATPAPPPKPSAHHAAHKTDKLHSTLNTRINAVEAKLAAARKANRITPAQAAPIRTQLANMRKEAKMYADQQGFLSAGESASYNRTLDGIEAKLR